MQPSDYIAAIDAALAICEARRAACDAATPGPWESEQSMRVDGGPDLGWIVIGMDDNQPIEAECYYRENARFIAAARTDHPASLRRDIAGLQAHREAEVKLAELLARFPQPSARRAARATIAGWATGCETHRDYSQRIFDDCGVTPAAELAKRQE